MKYNWQLPDWPKFRYELDEIEDLLYKFAEQTGHVSGILQTLPEDIQMEAIVDIMVSEAIKTSEIEGEYFSRQDVMASVRNNLGLNQTIENIKDKNAQGAGELMADVRKTYSETLDEEKLFSWHQMLFKESKGITVGGWRHHEEPMQVVSGALGKEKIHYEAPPSSSVPNEMDSFLQWFNNTAPGGEEELKKAPVRSAIAHLYFETIHPFEDGNGRVGRAIAEKALSQTLGRPVLLSLSKTIEANKKAYYNALSLAQTSNEITPWILYFVDVILKSQEEASKLVTFILKKSKFFDQYKRDLNERQIKVIRRMLDSGLEGFKGGMSAKKYMVITKASKATATRDLQDLLEKGVFILEGGGRSTNYSLNI